MEQLSIVGIKVNKRKEVAPKVQEVLTKHGENIITRFGSHDPGEKQSGLITLHVLATKDKLEEIASELSAIDGVTVKTMTMN